MLLIQIQLTLHEARNVICHHKLSRNLLNVNYQFFILIEAGYGYPN